MILSSDTAMIDALLTPKAASAAERHLDHAIAELGFPALDPAQQDTARGVIVSAFIRKMLGEQPTAGCCNSAKEGYLEAINLGIKDALPRLILQAEAASAAKSQA